MVLGRFLSSSPTGSCFLCLRPSASKREQCLCVADGLLGGPGYWGTRAAGGPGLLGGSGCCGARATGEPGLLGDPGCWGAQAAAGPTRAMPCSRRACGHLMAPTPGPCPQGSGGIRWTGDTGSTDFSRSHHPGSPSPGRRPTPARHSQDL